MIRANSPHSCCCCWLLFYSHSHIVVRAFGFCLLFVSVSEFVCLPVCVCMCELGSSSFICLPCLLLLLSRVVWSVLIRFFGMDDTYYGRVAGLWPELLCCRRRRCQHSFSIHRSDLVRPVINSSSLSPSCCPSFRFGYSGHS